MERFTTSLAENEFLQHCRASEISVKQALIWQPSIALLVFRAAKYSLIGV